jgi:DNA replication protein DnaC
VALAKAISVARSHKKRFATDSPHSTLVRPDCFETLGQPEPTEVSRELLRKISRTDVLVVDDWAMHPMSEAERRDFLEISEDRYQRRSTILTSQFAIRDWHKQIGDPTIADSILDRLVHNAYRIELKGESLRKTKGPKGGPKS